MGFERWRVHAAALAWCAAGALAESAGASHRFWVGAAVCALVGLAAAWPLGRPRPAPTVVLPGHQSADDAHRLAMLQAQIEHLPVAAWVQAGALLSPMTVSARRLLAPGGVRDADALRSFLRGAAESGPVELDTERGCERWQLRRLALALDGASQTLLVLVPLESALELESLRAWRQLVQVLTHEIMNSLTPIQSLSATAIDLLDDPAAGGDLRAALEAIARRAAGLSGFVGSYRRVSLSPAPVMAPVDVARLFAGLQLAVQARWQQRGGSASFSVDPPALQLLADAAQLEQALIALIDNAEQATARTDAPTLSVSAALTRGGRLRLSVRDNGPGVPPGLEPQIFLPFFSAREGGEGIGLTLVRQLVAGMGGRARHVRPLEGGAMFVLSF